MKNDLKHFDSDRFDPNDRDPDLTRLFAERNDPLPEDVFVPDLLTRFERARRKAWLRRTLFRLAGAGAAGGAIAWLSRPDVWRDVVPPELASPSLYSVVDPGALNVLIESPIAWAICIALLAATVPAAYVWKAWK